MEKVPTLSLQQGIVYGPVRSRRLGLSLGINLLPDEVKACSLNCRYCQYSWTGLLTNSGEQVRGFLPSRGTVGEAVERAVEEMVRRGTPPDVLTFSGNGEATLHPDFPAIVEDLLDIRARLAPGCRTAILSNATTVDREEIRKALLRLDDPVLKLDTGREETFRRLNAPAPGVRFQAVLDGLRTLGSRIILQALFVRGSVDNSTDEEVESWMEAVTFIRPRFVQIYTLDRGPADRGLLPVDAERLRAIATLLGRRAGVEGRVYG